MSSFLLFIFFSLRDVFETLVNKQYIKRCPIMTDQKTVPEFIADRSKEFKPPEVNIPKLVEASSGADVQFEDKVYWKINFKRFHQDIR